MTKLKKQTLIVCLCREKDYNKVSGVLNFDNVYLFSKIGITKFLSI